MSLAELIPIALVGTRTSSVRLPPIPADLSEVLPAKAADTTAVLLDMAAALTLIERAGLRTSTSIARPEPCPPDVWKECSPRAGEILSEVLETALQPVLAEWLRMAVRAERRAPHHLLPRLLEAAARKRSLQPAVATVIDRRGHWLTQFDRRWQFAQAVDQPPEETWQLGNRAQRGEALRLVRASDPGTARQWIAATWQNDGADERVDWVTTLQARLSDEDEPFLESCLDDRSSRVREAAAILLSQLPSSRLVARMLQRVESLIAFQPASTGSLLKLKRATKGRLDLTLPADFDKAMQRDGITEKPAQGTGPKQWWLEQMIGYVPLEHWTQRFGVSAMELIEGAPEEFSQVLLRGWLAALARRPVLEWIQPLVVAATKQVALERSLLTAIPAEQRAEFLSNVTRTGQRHPGELPDLLEAWTPLESEVSRLVIEVYGLSAVLSCEGHAHLHPSTFKEIERQIAKWAETPGHGNCGSHVLSVIALRRDLHKEFAT